MSEFLLKPWICFGQDALSVLDELTACHVLLVTDQAMVKFGLAERVTQRLCARGIDWQVWDDVVADPDIATVVRGMKLMDSCYRIWLSHSAVVRSLTQPKRLFSPWRKPVRKQDVNAPALWLFQPPAVRAQK